MNGDEVVAALILALGLRLMVTVALVILLWVWMLLLAVTPCWMLVLRWVPSGHCSLATAHSAAFGELTVLGIKWNGCAARVKKVKCSFFLE